MQPGDGAPKPASRTRAASEARCLAMFLTRLGDAALPGSKTEHGQALRAEMVSLTLCSRFPLKQGF
jgi:hypothetical protein